MFAFAAPFAAPFSALALIAAPQTAPVAPPAPAPAATPPPVEAAAPVATPTPDLTPAEPEQICRRQPIEGSRRMERVCHTRAEWDAIRENARNNRDAVSRNQRDGF